MTFQLRYLNNKKIWETMNHFRFTSQIFYFYMYKYTCTEFLFLYIQQFSQRVIVQCMYIHNIEDKLFFFLQKPLVFFKLNSVIFQLLDSIISLLYNSASINLFNCLSIPAKIGSSFIISLEIFRRPSTIRITLFFISSLQNFSNNS